jgi:hypothetical protein
MAVDHFQDARLFRGIRTDLDRHRVRFVSTRARDDAFAAELGQAGGI